MDKTPSFSLFFGRNDKLLWKCHASGQSGNAAELAKLILNCSYEEIREKIGNIQTKKQYADVVPVNEPANYSISVKPFDYFDLRYFDEYGISRKTVQETYKVRSIAKIQNNGRMIFQNKEQLAFGWNFTSFWKFYFPDRKFVTKFMGSMPATVMLGLQQLDNNPNVIITKSYKDVMCLRECGINGICIQTESRMLDSFLIGCIMRERKIKGLMFDNDEVGQTWAKKNCEFFGFNNIVPLSKDFAEMRKQDSEEAKYFIHSYF